MTTEETQNQIEKYRMSDKPHCAEITGLSKRTVYNVCAGKRVHKRTLDLMDKYISEYK